MSSNCQSNGSDYHNSFLHNLQIASPCKADWDKMTGDERARFCHDCKLNVYNIEEMTLAEAEELIIEKEGNVCLRLYRRNDGKVITKDCPVGFADRLKKRCGMVVGALAAVTSVIFGWIGQTKTATAEPGVEPPAVERASHRVGQLVRESRNVGKIRKDYSRTSGRTMGKRKPD